MKSKLHFHMIIAKEETFPSRGIARSGGHSLARAFDGPRSSPSERARESDRYGQVGHIGSPGVAPPARSIGGASKWPFLSPQTFPERRRRQVAIFRFDPNRAGPPSTVLRPHSRWRTAESVSETFVRADWKVESGVVHKFGGAAGGIVARTRDDRRITSGRGESAVLVACDPSAGVLSGRSIRTYR